MMGPLYKKKSAYKLEPKKDCRQGQSGRQNLAVFKAFYILKIFIYSCLSNMGELKKEI